MCLIYIATPLTFKTFNIFSHSNIFSNFNFCTFYMDKIYESKNDYLHLYFNLLSIYLPFNLTIVACLIFYYNVKVNFKWTIVT